MLSSARQLVRRAMLPLSVVLCVPACRSADTREATIHGEKALLQKEIDGLNRLIAALEQGSLAGPRQLVIGADESTVESLIAATLPQERVISKRFRIRLEKAKVQFRGNQGIVTLFGRATAENTPGTFVDVALKGALNDLTVRPESGAILGRVGIYMLEVQRASAIGAENRAVRELAKALGQARADSLSELGPSVVIPIKLHEDIDIPALDSDVLSVSPGSLHVQLKVAQVIAVSGRLWVMLDVAAGPWYAKGQEHPQEQERPQ